MHTTNLESNLESIETQTEQTVNEESQLVKSLEELDTCIRSIEEDSDMLRWAENKRNVCQEALLENQGKLEELFLKGQEVCQQLHIYAQEIVKEKKYLDELSYLGEDVSEAYTILSARSEKIDTLMDRMDKIFFRLEKSSDSYILKDMGQMFGENITSDESYLDNFSKNQLMGMKRTIRTNFTEVSGDRKNVRNYVKK